MSSAATKSKNRLVKLAEALARLGCKRATFYRRWRDVVTDPRSDEEKAAASAPIGERSTFERKVYEDEPNIAVEKANKGKAAVLNYRRLKKRL